MGGTCTPADVKATQVGTRQGQAAGFRNAIAGATRRGAVNRREGWVVAPRLIGRPARGPGNSNRKSSEFSLVLHPSAQTNRRWVSSVVSCSSMTSC